jgi:hypothetical protein
MVEEGSVPGVALLQTEGGQVRGLSKGLILLRLLARGGIYVLKVRNRERGL